MHYTMLYNVSAASCAPRLKSGDGEKDIGFGSHILFYCSNMAEQDTTQYKQHTHTIIHTHVDTWKDKQKKVNLYADSSESRMIDAASPASQGIN